MTNGLSKHHSEAAGQELDLRWPTQNEMRIGKHVIFMHETRACPQNETEHTIQPREALIKHDS